MLRRVPSTISRVAAVSSVPLRPILSTWGMDQKYWDNSKAKRSFTQLWKDRLNSTYWKDSHAADVAAPEYAFPVRMFLSELEADIADLSATDWGLELSHHWIDQLEYQRNAFKLFARRGWIESHMFMSFLLTQHNATDEEIGEMTAKMTQFEQLVQTALATEELVSDIYEQRYAFLRNINSTGSWQQREALLADGTAKLLAMLESCPAEYAPKVKNTVEFHLFANRHWTHECPDVKKAFPDYMA